MDAPMERQGASRGGEGCESRIQRFCRNFAQGRDIRPHQSGADGPVWIEPRQHGAIKRQLHDIALIVLLRLRDASGRRTIGAI